MSNDDLSPVTLPKFLAGPISAEDLAVFMVPRSDLTYRKFERLEIAEVDINRSLLTGSFIRECTFYKVIFSRSDLDGLRIENTTFNECDFTSCDFRASIFINCKFQSCILNSTFIDDCEFQICEFNTCTFRVGSLTRCRFQKSSLRACDLKQATFLHNKLYNTSVSEMIFGDCALQYLILRDCNFMGVTLAAESVGAMFGLTREQLFDAKMIYLGNDESIPLDSEVISLLLEEYEKRNWHVGQLVLSVNFGLTSTLSAFDNYLSLAYKRFANFGFANGDELEFLGDLFDELAFLNRLPLLTVLNTLEWCTQLEQEINKSNFGFTGNSGDSLRILASRLALLANTLLDKFEYALPAFDNLEVKTSICLRTTFEQKPIVELPELLNSLTDSLNLGNEHRSVRVGKESGSYVEIVFTTLFSVIAFQAFLYLINGCIIQLTEMKHRVKVLTNKKGPKTYKEIALSPVQKPSPIIMSVLANLTEYAKGLGWLKDTSLSGYSAPNIKSLEEVQCDTSQVPPM